MNNKSHLKIYAIGATVILILIIIITILVTRSITLESINSESQAVGSNATDLAKEGTLTPDPSATLSEQANPSSVVAVESKTSTPHEDSTPPTTPPSTAPSTAPSPNIVELYRGEPFDAGCNTPEGNLVVPQSLGRADAWERVGEQFVLPRKKGVGPGKITGLVRHCFAKSGEGLIYAATTYILQSPAYTEFSSQSAQRLFIHPDYAKEVSEHNNKLLSQGSVNDKLEQVTEFRPVGWQITDLNSEDGSAQVSIAYLAPALDGTSRMLEAQARLKWANGDWRLASHPSLTPIQGLSPMMQPLE